MELTWNITTFEQQALFGGLAAVLCAAAVIDWRRRVIPDALVACVMGLWCVLALLRWGQAPIGSYAECLGAAVLVVAGLLLVDWLCGGLVSDKGFGSPDARGDARLGAADVCGGAEFEDVGDSAFGRCFIGGGDIKLLGALALFLGPWGSLLCLLLSCVAGLLMAAIARSATFPFAPSICIGALVALVACPWPL